MTNSEFEKIINQQEMMIQELEFKIQDEEKRMKKSSKVSEKLEMIFNLATSVTMFFAAIILFLVIIKIL